MRLHRKLSPETKTKMSLAHTGVKFTEEHKQKIGLANQGLKRTPEQKQRMSEAQKRYWATVPE